MSADTILMEMWRTMGGNSDENESMASFSFPDFLFPNSQDPGFFYFLFSGKSVRESSVNFAFIVVFSMESY
jgi:hypothetical protein